MTREEVLNMEAGQEMDNLIAEKVMGWHKVHEFGRYVWHNAEGQYQHAVARWDGLYEDEEDFNLIFWHPSESIMWAWDVETKIYEDGNAVEYVNALREIVLKDDESKVQDDWLHWFLTLHAEPVQRCKAALLAVWDGE